MIEELSRRGSYKAGQGWKERNEPRRDIELRESDVGGGHTLDR